MTSGQHPSKFCTRLEANVPPEDGHIDFFNGIETRRLSIEVDYDRDGCPGADIVLDPNGWVQRHPFSEPRDSTDEERAAVGWTW